MPSKTDIYKQTYSEDDFPGLDAINQRQKEIYGNIEPSHFAPPIPYELGGDEPLWAEAVYLWPDFKPLLPT